MAKPTRPRPRRKVAVKVDKVRIAKVKVDKVRAEKAKVDKVRVDKKCLGCSAERTERIKLTTAVIALVAAILGLMLFFGKQTVEAGKQPTPPAAPIQQNIQCAPEITITVPADKKDSQ